MCKKLLFVVAASLLFCGFPLAAAQTAIQTAAHAATKLITLASLAIPVSSNCLKPMLPKPPFGRVLQARQPTANR